MRHGTAWEEKVTNAKRSIEKALFLNVNYVVRADEKGTSRVAAKCVAEVQSLGEMFSIFLANDHDFFCIRPMRLEPAGFHDRFQNGHWAIQQDFPRFQNSTGHVNRNGAGFQSNNYFLVLELGLIEMAEFRLEFSQLLAGSFDLPDQWEVDLTVGANFLRVIQLRDAGNERLRGRRLRRRFDGLLQ